MERKIIPIIHLIIGFVYSFYALLVPSKFIYDYCYYVFLVCLQISWIVYNHECPLSYYYKQKYYKNYNCGDTTTLDDFNELVGRPKNNTNNTKGEIDIGKLVDNIFMVALIYSIIAVNIRSKIGNMYLVIFVYIFIRFFYLLFNSAVGWNTKEILGAKNYRIYMKLYNMYKIIYIHNEINTGIVAIMGLFFIYITYRNRKRF